MVITVVCDVLGAETNGTVVAARNLINSLKEKGHEVRVLCPEIDMMGKEGYFVVPVHNFGKPLNDYVKKVGVSLAKPDKRIIKQALLGADVVHIIVPLGLGLATAKIAKKMDIPITAGFHMQAENLTSQLKLDKLWLANYAVYKYIYNHLYRYCSAIHYPTDFIRGVFETNVKKITNGYVISNGVHNYVKKRDVPKPEELKDKIVILSTGRYGREKSQDTLIKAVAQSKYKDKIQIILAGLGPKEKQYKKLSKKLPIQPILKVFPREEIIDALNYCDLYVHPADVELEGIACLEAVACGKLTIVSDSKLSATKEFAVDERCIFKKRDPKDLARVIDFWLDNPEEKKICEQKYYENAHKFDLDECMDKMEQMLLDASKKI